MGLLSNIVADFRLTQSDLPRIHRQLFYDGEDRRRNLERFGILMFFATLIAAYGVIGDSTATVIGAMLIAPLMTPVLAIAVAFVTGDMHRATFSLLVVVGGVLGAILLAFCIGISFRSGIIGIDTNSQILSRVSPRLVDLGAALGAGAIGAFASSREDIADTLPGAAIAIALVPPLSVVGLLLSQGAWAEAWGAMMLFLTNFFAILLAGSLVFVLLGLSAASVGNLSGHARRRAFEWIALGTLLVALPLAATSFHAVTGARNRDRATTVVNEWLESSNFELVSVSVGADDISVAIKGEGVPPPVAQLIDIIRAQTQEELSVSLEILPVQRRQVDLPAIDQQDQ